MPYALTLKQAAEQLGVHYMTVYRYVRLGLLPATRNSSGWLVDPADLAQMVAPNQGGPARTRKTQWHRRLETRLLAGDEAGSWSVVEAALAAGVSPSCVYTEMLGPALRSIGEKWASGEIDVADEHLASAIAGRLIGRLGPRFARRGRARGTVVVTTPPGDRHGLGVAMLADLFRGAHFRIVDLGSDVPFESLARVIREIDDLVALCVSVFTPGRDEIVAETIRTASDLGARVLVGGPAIEDQAHAQSLGAAGWAPDGSGAVEVVESWL